MFSVVPPWEEEGVRNCQLSSELQASPVLLSGPAAKEEQVTSMDLAQITILSSIQCSTISFSVKGGSHLKNSDYTSFLIGIEGPTDLQQIHEVKLLLILRPVFPEAVGPAHLGASQLQPLMPEQMGVVIEEHAC